MRISHAAVDAYLARRLDSFQWIKKLPRQDFVAELDSLRVKPRFKTDPWLHQLACFYLGICYPRFMYLLDMGAGKSKILMDLATQRIRERKVERALLTVPRVINIDSWGDDIAKHSDLEPVLCDIPSIEQKWELLLQGKGDVTIIDYQGLFLALSKKKKKGKGLELDYDKVEKLQRRFQFIGIDEIHKLKNESTQWWRCVNELSTTASFVYGSTGTLFTKRAEDIFPQFKVVDQGETFGESDGLFKAAFFKQTVTGWAVEWELDRAMLPELHTMLQHRSIRYNEREFSDVPKERYIEVKVGMSDDQREQYLLALEGLVNAGGSLKEVDGSWLKMRNIASGFLSWKDESGKHEVRFPKAPKLLALERILDEAGDNKVVVSVEYTGAGSLITDMLREKGIGHVWLYGGTKDHSAVRRKFLEDPATQVLVMNSESGGTGLDGLQKVSKYLVLYECPKSRKQTIKRLVRAGQKERVYVYDLVTKGSVDVTILEDAIEGIDSHERVVDSPRSAARKLKQLFDSSR